MKLELASLAHSAAAAGRRAINGLLGRRFSKHVVAAVGQAFAGAGAVAPGCLGALPQPAAECAIPHIATTAPWIRAGDFSVSYGVYLDQLSMVMVLVVTSVGFLIHIYSIGYMAHEGGYYRFFSYLNLFMFFMLTLVLANNYLLMFVGWEGVGLASYLLIGFFFLRDSAGHRGQESVHRQPHRRLRFPDRAVSADQALRLAGFQRAFSPRCQGCRVEKRRRPADRHRAAAVDRRLPASRRSFRCTSGCRTRWKAPRRSRALIHAATMVTAGVYMVARSNAIFNRAPSRCWRSPSSAALTALFAATIGMAQTRHQERARLFHHLAARLHVPGLRRGGIFGGHLPPDDPRLLQGAAVPGRGLGDPRPRRRAGHAPDGRPAQANPVDLLDDDGRDLRHCRHSPLFRFFSKDEILWKASRARSELGFWAVGVLTAFLTSFYMFRLWFLTFFGEFRGAVHEQHPRDATATRQAFDAESQR